MDTARRSRNPTHGWLNDPRISAKTLAFLRSRDARSSPERELDALSPND